MDVACTNADMFYTFGSTRFPPKTVLDGGASAGALAHRTIALAERSGAVETAAVVIADGRLLPDGQGIRPLAGIRGRAEGAPYQTTV